MKKIVLFLSAMLALSAPAQIQVTTEPFDTIRFEISKNSKVIVNATVNNDTVPLCFLFDTGAIDNTLNVNSPCALNAISQDWLKEGEVLTATSATSARCTPYNNSITIGGTEFQGVRFFLAPCAEDIDGIIGWNTLTGADFLIDYDRQRILLYDSGECEIADTTLWLPLNYIGGLPSIRLSFCFAGTQYAADFMLDSGSDRCLDISTPFIAENRLEGRQKPWGFSQIAGMDGKESRIAECIAEKVCIGPYQLYQIPIGLNLSNAGSAANQHFDGCIGNNLLQRFNQIWSFARKRLCLQPNRRMYAAPYAPQEGLLRNRVKLE